MTSTVDDLLRKIKSLEQELIEEIQSQQQDFTYEIQKKRIYFEKNVIQQHKHYLQQLFDYLKKSSLKHILSAPLIWAVLIPTLLLDITVTLYQAFCFPIYGIPKVKRADFIVFDRQYLNYLNIIEKMNCAYCSYFNGIIAYIQEIAARTEQFWCPIKHAHHISTLHNRYQHFLDYGDAKSYRQQKEEIRQKFDDLKHNDY
ncbi:MAG: hypothetical protein L3J75_17355 [Methylococcaceae bacterium]|nr:hypothetical protein [Methylococcaceae bacterium]